MFVKGIMKPKHRCFTTNLNETLTSVLNLLNKEDIQAVPVLEDNKFVGMISKQMIYQSFFESKESNKEDFLASHKVVDLVDHADLHITDEAVFEKTLTTFKDFSVLAVTDESKIFIGLVTRYDVLEQFESAFGMRKSGVRIAFTSIESEGRISRLADIIQHFHGNVISLATFDETDKLARRIVLKIEKNENVEKLTKRLEKSGFRILDVKEM
ncbi:CBS domain-containing protein [Salirhabdus euzebyi]|uniref:CBS domain-containing protein n=1 Tax=Salirhabdus euzebyi TaxID=394506 RepID=A0A841Q310_9BACI|nr:CBS domain-containing protein [Salirhabdus euzebyi]MBB6452178.1 CBS domain-containing protein [Salirhabdus euzebyi]